MAKKSLLLVDADPRSLRVLEVSLRKAGYSVATCVDASSALETIDLSQPDLILSDTRLPGMNGFELVEVLRGKEEHKTVPLMFLSSDASVESKVRGLELGVEDYLTKPIYIKEIITRINLTLQRQEREGLARRTSVSKTRFTGSLGDMGLVDLLQTIDISRKSGVLELANGPTEGTISFRDGQLVDAQQGRLTAESAIYRLLLWNEGEFEIDFRPVRVEQRIRASTQAILMEGMRRIDEWGRILEQIPSLDNVFEVSEEELMERLAEIPDEINAILRHIDGRRSLLEVVDLCEGDDLESLTAITKLYFEGIIFPTGRTTSDVDGDEPLSPDLLVGETGTPPRALDDDASDPGLVPRAKTDRPPDRAKANVTVPRASDAVSLRAASAPAPALDRSRNDDLPELGTGPADYGAPSPSWAPKAGSTVGPTSTRPGALGGSPLDPPVIHERSEDESMGTRKGRRKRRRRAKTENALQAHDSGFLEEANNVIQFPAQAKHAVGGASSQVAVNDRSGSLESEDIDEDDEDEDEDEGVAQRQDATRTVRRDEPVHIELSLLDPEPEPVAPVAVEARSSKRPESELAAAIKAKTNPPPRPNAPATAVVETARRIEAPKPEPVPVKVEPKIEEPRAAKAEAPKPSAAPVAKAEAAVEPKAELRADVLKDEATVADKAARDPRNIAPPAAVALAEADAPVKDVSNTGRTRTTSSAEIRAVTVTGEHAAVAVDFFSDPPPASEENWDDLKTSALPMSPAMVRAKYATFAILALGTLTLVSYWLYNNVYMPAPAPLAGVGQTLELPPAADTPANDEESAAVATDEAATDEAATDEVVTDEVVTDEVPTDEVVADEVATDVVPDQPVAEVVPPPPPGVDGAQLSQQALRELNRSRNEDAQRLAQQAVTADPGQALGWLVLGAARQALGAPPEQWRAAYQSCVDLGAGPYQRDCRAMLR